MMEKIQKDFNISANYIEDHYKKVREIFAFLSTFQMPRWEEGKITFAEIKQKIQLFTEWNAEIKSKIKDVPKGCLNINGSKIANHITRDLESKLETYKNQLTLLMKNKMQRTSENIDSYIKILTNPHETVKEYGDYIENYNKILNDLKSL